MKKLNRKAVDKSSGVNAKGRAVGDLPPAVLKVEGGVPRLYVHGRRTPPLMFWTPLPPSVERMRSFAQQDVHLFSFDLSAREWWTGPEQCDFKVLTDRLGLVREADPDGLLLVRLDVNPPGWWIEQHPAERMVVISRDGKSGSPGRASMGSALWRKEVGVVLEKLIAHFRNSPLARHILGWHVAAGDCGEWCYHWGESCSDYGPGQLKAFRLWLENRYRTDAALREAWHRPDADFAAAEIPPPTRRYTTGLGELFDPAKDRDVIDYLQFHSETVADAIVEFAAIARRASGGRHLVGAFYGYSLSPGWRPADWHGNGHHALRRVLDCPDLDFIAAPYNYRDRYPGQACVTQTLPEAVRLAGKLCWLEDDTRTCLMTDGGTQNFGRCPDLPTTVGVLRRNWAAATTQSGGLWWMEQSAGWFEHPKVLAEIGRLRQLHDSLTDRALHSRAEIAVVISQHSQAFMAQTPNLFIPLLAGQMTQELAHLGAPFDLILSSDLPRTRDYKLYLFPAAYYLPANERKAVAALYRKGHTIVWTHAPGLVTDRGIDDAAASALVGMDLKLEKIGGPLHVRITDFEHPFTRGLAPGTQYGTDCRIAPVLDVTDSKVIVLGKAGSTSLDVLDGIENWPLFSYYRPGLVLKKVNGANVVFSATGPVSSTVMRNIAREAGVHIYSAGGDVVYASTGLLAVHYASSGKRALRLPSGTVAVDTVTGKKVSNAIGKIQRDARLGATDLFVLK